MADGINLSFGYYYFIHLSWKRLSEKMIKMKALRQNPINAYEKQEINRKSRRLVLRIFSIFSIISGWSVPLLMIIDVLPDTLFLMFLGTVLIGIGFILQLLISSGEI